MEVLASAVPVRAAERLDSAVPALPRHVRALIDRRMLCNHWAGEEAYDAGRGEHIAAAIAELRCDRIARDEAALLRRYRDNARAVTALRAARDGF